MIQKFVDRFINRKDELQKLLGEKHPESYKELVTHVVNFIREEDGYDQPDPERIHEINDGDYQGTLLYVIAADGYHPGTYWAVFVSYGSCSGCDTLEAIRYDYSANYDEAPNTKQIDEYWTLCLHIVQKLKAMEAWGEV